MKAKFIPISLILTSLFLILSCHQYDPKEQPVVKVSSGLRPEISWDPPDGWRIEVYKGQFDGDGFNVLWSCSANRYANEMNSPVMYGEPPEEGYGKPAPPLEPGEIYTIVVDRHDDKGSGDGFTNTRKRYMGTITFIAWKINGKIL